MQLDLHEKLAQNLKIVGLTPTVGLDYLLQEICPKHRDLVLG